MSAQLTDADAVLDAVEQIITGRLTKLRREYERSLAKGVQPHMVVANKAERIEYVRDSLREVRAALAELTAAANLAAEWIDEARVRKGLPTAITLPRLNAALARIGAKP